MDILTLLQNLFSDYTLRTVALGAGVLGIVSGALGSYAVLRKQALLGDAVSHAALPGIAIAFMLTGSKAPLVLVLGAAIAGWLATLLMISIVKTTRLKDDSVLGLLLSVFFGFGLVLLTFIQRTPNAAKAGLDKFLFGQAATLLASDVITMSVLGLIVLAFVALLWKEFKLLSFDPAFGASLGFRMRLARCGVDHAHRRGDCGGLADRRRGVDERDVRRARLGGPPMDRSAGGHDRAGGAVRCDRGCQRRGDQQQHHASAYRPDDRAVRQRAGIHLAVLRAQSRAGVELGAAAAQQTPTAHRFRAGRSLHAVAAAQRSEPRALHLGACAP